MTESSTETSITQEQPAVQVATGDTSIIQPEAFSDAEIVALAKGEATLPETTVEGGDDYAEQEPEPTQEPVEQQAAEPEKKRNERIPRARFDEVNEQKNIYKSQAESAEQRAKSAEAEKQKLLDFINKLTGEQEKKAEAPALPDDVIDEATFKVATDAAKKLETIEKKLEIAEFDTAINRERAVGAEKYTGFAQAEDTFIASRAFDVMNRVEAMGDQITPEQAIIVAQTEIAHELKAVRAKNNTPGAIADYVFKQAQARGYKPQAATKPVSDKPKVNMQAVQRARDEAGMPAIERESVKINTADWQQDVASMAKKDFGDKSNRYLQKMGVG